jgi:hypothetical protein
MWADVAWRSSRSEVISDAIFYSQQLMEEIKSKRFDNRTSSPWTNSADLGVDTGETRSDKNTFNDVDDFKTVCLPGDSGYPTCDKTCTDTLVTTPANRYIRSVIVEYVYLDASNDWQLCCTNPPCPPNPPAITCASEVDCANCNQCCHKRITVTVSRTDNLVRDINLITIVSGLK